MPKGGGSKTPQLDHFPLNTDMVEKQGGKKVRLTSLQTHTGPKPHVCMQHIALALISAFPRNLPLSKG